MESAPGSKKQNRISELRMAITRAEQSEDHEKIVLLEAELKAVERDEEFNRDEFLLSRAYSRSRPKHHVLRDMHRLYSNEPTDIWRYDGLQRDARFSYEETFQPILSQLGVKSFQELVDQKALELSKDVKVLDLFGGAYFLKNLGHVSRMVGVRLQNIDKQLLEAIENALEENDNNRFTEDLRTDHQLLTNLMNNPKRYIIEGNLYKGKTWTELKKDNKQHGGAGFNIVICRPAGPFRDSSRSEHNITDIQDGGIAREEIFTILLERGLNILSDEESILFIQTPDLGTDAEILDIFWKRYIPQKQKEGYEFLFGAGRSMPHADTFAVRRNQKSSKIIGGQPSS